LIPDKARYQICTAERVTATIVEAWLRPLAEQIDFQSGQYVLMEDADRQIPPRSEDARSGPIAGDLSRSRRSRGVHSGFSRIHSRLYGCGGSTRRGM
jgi:hypothetical protein